MSTSGLAPSPGAPLPAWREGATKRAILDFVAAVTDPQGTEYVPPAARIATFDNDGTLWSEKPLIQGLFILERARAMMAADPALNEDVVFARAIAGEIRIPQDIKLVVELAARTHTGMSRNEFKALARNFFDTVRLGPQRRPVGAQVFLPMRELLDYLVAHDFKCFISTGGTIDFVRIISQELYAIPPEQVIGTDWKTHLEERDGGVELIIDPTLGTFNDKAAKPGGIELHIGRRPILAAGNVGGEGDIQMLRYCQSRPGATLQLMVHHDDAEREAAYDEPSGASLAAAAQYGWQVVSVRDDWAQVMGESHGN
jgi:hypothetical protein